MANDLVVALKITADTRQAEGELNTAAQSADRLGQQAEDASSSIDKLGGLGIVAAKGALAISELTELFGRFGSVAADLSFLLQPRHSLQTG